MPWTVWPNGNFRLLGSHKFDPELEHRLGRVPELANRVLRVIVTKSDPLRVVTMHLDRKMKHKL